MIDRSLRNPINWAFARPLKVLATLGNSFFAGVETVKLSVRRGTVAIISQTVYNINIETEVRCMTERMTWKEIQGNYPDQWVGLIDVKYIDNDGISIESAVIKYLDKGKGELAKLALQGEIVSRYTTPDNIFQLGMVEVVG